MMNLDDIVGWYAENVLAGPFTHFYRVAEWAEDRWGLGAAILTGLAMLPLVVMGLVLVAFVAAPLALLAAVPLSVYDIVQTARRKRRA